LSPVWNNDFRLVLASGSGTRRRLLAAAGLPFATRTPDVDERAIETGLPNAAAADIALALARAKALAVCAEAPGALVLGADQVLSLESQVLHKSQTREEALQTLTKLSGKTHRLTSAFALARDGEVLAAEAEAAELTLRALDENRLRLYLDAVGDDVLDSVGVYQLESFGVHLFAEVKGEHTTILGLPMLKLLAALRALGALHL
jgi:septum formation protein